MQRWRGLEDIPDDWGRCVAAIGVFDGVHRGHRSILRRAGERARELGLPVVVLTFDPHPDSVVGGAPHPPLLTSPERKARLLQSHGADAVCVLAFTPELAQLCAEDFVQHVLVDRLRTAAVVVGEDFRFGHKAAGDITTLQTLGEKYDFAVDGVRLVSDTDTITSTLIRQHISEGDVERAWEGLGRPHRVEGVVVHGAARGRELLGYPTANLDCPPGTAIPADGVYAGRLLRTEPSGGAESSWPAAVSVGTNPTFEGGSRSVEAYALDQEDLDLYGEAMGVEFLRHIRPMLRFDGVEELIEAMHDDVKSAREFLTGS